MGVKIIAEVASNHQGDIALAGKFIRAACDAGVDCVKFQSSRYEDLVNKDDPQAQWVQRTSLCDKDHFDLIEECRKNKIQFLTTCFSITRVDFLASLGIEEIKVASPDLLSFSMIEKLSEHFKHLIISVGMHNRQQIKSAIQFLLKNKINATLLHAVSVYPTPLDKSFMLKFLWLKDNFPHVGYSHHTSNTEPLKFAIAQGAEIVEAHMKLGKDGPGRAAPWDILPEDFADLVEYRDTLNHILGNQQWLADQQFLFPQEIQAAKRFIGRWGNNK